MLEHHKIRPCRTTLFHPKSNGKCEKFNGILKEIMFSLTLDFPDQPFDAIVTIALRLYRERPMSNGQSPYFSTYGCHTPQSTKTDHVQYNREANNTEEREYQNLVAIHHGEDGVQSYRHQVNNVAQAKNTIRSILAKSKALYREFAVGDWVIRKRIKKHKFEPAADGPYPIVEALPNNAYKLRTLNGKELKNNYSASLLFPAYTIDGQPVDSPFHS